MKNKYQKEIWTIPNILSMFRIALIPVLVWMYVVVQDDFMTLCLLSLSGITDIVDGIIARKFQMISDFGKVLDPVADKLTQTAMLVCLVIKYELMLMPLTLLIIKEVCNAITGYLSIKRTATVQGADWHGKLSTILLYIMMAAHLVWIDIPETVSAGLVGLCMMAMLISLVLYFVRNVKCIVNKTF